MTEECTVFRQDRIQTSTEDLAKGGIMIVCPSSLQPVRMNVPHPPQLEILTVKTSSTNSVGRMCIIAVYRRPQLATFLSLGDYLANLPQIVPTIIVDDFNEDSSRSNSSRLLQLMTSRGFSQLVQVPTTDSGSLLDHIYFNGIIENSFVDVIDTYYLDHDATCLSFQILHISGI